MVFFDKLRYSFFSFSSGGAVAQWVERTTSGQEAVGLIPAPGACSLLVGSVSI